MFKTLFSTCLFLFLFFQISVCQEFEMLTNIEGEDVFGCTASDFVGAGGNVYFAFCDGNLNKSTIWKTDGTPDGTKKVSVVDGEDKYVLFFYEGYYAASPDLLCYRGYNSINSSTLEIWFAEDDQVYRLGEEGNYYSSLSDVEYAEGYFWFSAIRSGEKGIYRSDGTNEGTTLVVNELALGINVGQMLAVKDDKIYFQYEESGGDDLLLLGEYDIQNETLTPFVNEVNGVPQEIYGRFNLHNDRIVYTNDYGDFSQRQIWEAPLSTLVGEPVSVIGTNVGLFYFYFDENTYLYSGQVDGESTLFKRSFDNPEPLALMDSPTNSLFFGGADSKEGDYLYFGRLWRTDGTVEGTIEISPNGSRVKTYNGHTYFRNSQLGDLARFGDDPTDIEVLDIPGVEVATISEMSEYIDGKLIFAAAIEGGAALFSLSLPPNSVDNSIEGELSLTTVPNPAKDRCTILLPEELHNTKSSVSVYSPDGKVVAQYQFETVGEQVQLEFPVGLTNGMYFIHLQNAERYASGKLIVSK